MTVSSLPFVIVFLFISFFGEAKNYYFSSVTGNDSRTIVQAQNPGTPLKSLKQLNLFFKNIQPGDSILFKRGEVFFGSIIINKSGSSSQPLTFGAFGKGPKPIISGFITLDSWSAMGNGVYQASCTGCDNELNMLILNGVPQPLGRFPNSGYLSYETQVNNSSITDKQLTKFPVWTGAQIVIKKNRWIIDKGTITAHVGNTLRYSNTSDEVPIPNFGYFISNHPKTLDRLGEWFFNPVDKKVRIYLGNNNPGKFIIKLSAIKNLVNIKGFNHIGFSDISFEGANDDSFYLNDAQYISIKNCQVKFSGSDAVAASWSSYLSIDNSFISHSQNNGLSLDAGCSYALLTNNLICNTGLMPGMGQNGTGTYQAIMAFGKKSLIEFNTIDSTGYNGIYFGGNSSEAKHNFIKNFCLIKDDGGGIYIGDWFASTDKKITGNIILNGRGTGEGTNDPTYKAAQGIYIDEKSAGVKITNNSVANCSDNGIVIHNAKEIVVEGNHVYNNHNQFRIDYDNNSTAGSYKKNIIKNNVFFSKDLFQLSSYYSISNGSIKYIGFFDNNYYSRPMDDNVTIKTMDVKNNYISQFHNLEMWRLAYGHDLHSKVSPIKIPAYNVNRIFAPNKYHNANFSNNIGGVYCWSPEGNCLTSLNNSGKIDGNTLQLSIKNTTGTSQLGKVSYLIVDIGKVEAGKQYILKFSALGSLPFKIFKMALRKSKSPYTYIHERKNGIITNTKKDYEFLFSSTTSEPEASLILEVDEQEDFTGWYDNLQFYEANITLTNPDDYFRFEYNAGKEIKYINLEQVYQDVQGNKYNGQVALKPYQSLILLKPYTRMALKISSTEVPDIKDYKVYPNPVDDFLNIQLNQVPKDPTVTIFIWSVTGTLVKKFSNPFIKNNVTLDIGQLPKGLYLLSMDIDEVPFTTKFKKL